MTKIVLIRHGQTEWNITGRFQGQSDVKLTETGKKQASELAERFPFNKIDAVYASDLSRAMYTAKAIADRFGLEVTPLPEVREFHFGEWEGLTYNQICEGWPAAIENFFDKPDELQAPNGESFPVVQQRAVAGINELVKKHEGQVIAIVAHGAVNRTILAEALGLPLRNLWRIRQDNTAVNVIRYDEGFRNVELVNSTFHLSERPSGGAPQNR